MTYTIDSFLTTPSENTKLINISSRFTVTEADALEDFLQSIPTNLQNSSGNKVVLDFGQTIFIDNKGLVGLCKILRLAKTKEINLSFLSFSPQVKIVLSLVGLKHLFLLENANSHSINSLI